jgi:hypothetical protein
MFSCCRVLARPKPPLPAPVLDAELANWRTGELPIEAKLIMLI